MSIIRQSIKTIESNDLIFGPVLKSKLDEQNYTDSCHNSFEICPEMVKIKYN